MGFCKRKGVDCDIIGTTWLSQCNLSGCFKNLPDVKEDKYLGDGYCHKKGIYCEKTYLNPKGCKECTVGFSNMDKLEFKGSLSDCVMGTVDAKTGGKEFAIGTKNHGDSFVLNFGNKSCLLLFGNCQPIDLRQFDFNEITSIEINGNKFIKEN